VAKDEPEEISAPLWCLTYGDMITQCMAFFVMLFALSEVRSDKARMVAAQISRAFNRNSGSGGAVGLKTATSFARYRKAALESAVTGPDLRVLSFPQGRKIVIGGHVLFRRGGADLLPDGRRKIDEVVDMVKGYRNKIEIRGHASRNELSPGARWDEWELSWYRAKAVADYLSKEKNIPESRLRISGASYWDPAEISMFANEEARNRRVELVEVGEFAP
jgi:chemotaxis protein MotB